MTSSNSNIFRVSGYLCVEFNGPSEFHPHRPVTRSFDVFFDLRLIKRFSKHLLGRWSGTPSRSLLRHRNDSACLWQRVELYDNDVHVSVVPVDHRLYNYVDLHKFAWLSTYVFM